MMGNSSVGRRVGHCQEIAGLGTEDEVGNLVVENVEVEVRPREGNAIGEDPFQPITRHVLHLGTAAQVVVYDPQFRNVVLCGPGDESRSRVFGAGCGCHGRVDRRQPMGAGQGGSYTVAFAVRWFRKRQASRGAAASYI